MTFGRDWQGHRVRRKQRCKTKREADLLDARWSLEKQVQGGTATGEMTFAEFVEVVYWPQKANAMRATSRRGYERDLKLRLLPAFGSLGLRNVNRLAIQQMLNGCPTKKAATNARETLSAVLTVAVEMELIQKNPAMYTYSFPEEGRHEKDHYGVWLSTFAEHVRLLDWAKANYRDRAEERMLVIGLCFGLRKGEILGLDWENVDLENRQIRITQTFTSATGKPSLTEPKTKRSKRIVPMPEYAYQRLSAWSDQQKFEDVDLHGDVCHPVVTGMTHKRLSPKTASDKIARMRNGKSYEDGTPVPGITLFSTRHSFATACINAGMEVSKLSAILGHANTAVTYNRYVKPKLKDIKQEIPIIDAAYSEAREG